MHKSKLSIAGLLAAGLTGLLAADGSVANAQTPSAPTTRAEEKVETRPGPLDLIVYFRASGSDIDTASNSSLDELAVWLREDRTRVVFIEEHPDDAKAAGFDAKLGGDRMDSTRRYLVAHGAMDSQIKSVAHGQKSAAKVGDRNSRTVFISIAGGEGLVTGGAGIDASAGVGTAGMSAGAGVGVQDDPALAPVEPTPVYTPVPAEPLYTPPVVKTDGPERPMLTPFGMSLAVGGGVVGFFDSDTRGFTDPGGSWEARLTVGTRSPLAFEAAYYGTAQNIEALGLDSDSVLVGTSFEGDARLNLTRMAVQPYLFGGIGYTRYDISNSDFNTSSLHSKEEMGHIPVGAGLGWRAGALLLDVRGTLRAAFDDGLRRTGEEDDEIIPDEDEGATRAELDTWNVTGRIGFEF